MVIVSFQAGPVPLEYKNGPLLPELIGLTYTPEVLFVVTTVGLAIVFMVFLMLCGIG
jgi:hypothetical protein